MTNKDKGFQGKKSGFARANSKTDTHKDAKEKISALSEVILDRRLTQKLRVDSLKEALVFGENVFSLKDRLILISILLKQKDFASPYYLVVKTLEKDIRQKQKTVIASKIEKHIKYLQTSQKTFNSEKYAEIQKQVEIFREAEKLGTNAFKGAGRHHFFWTYVAIQKYLGNSESHLENNRQMNNQFLESLESLVVMKRWNKFEQGSRKAKKTNCMIYAAVFGIFNDVDFSYDACRAVIKFGNEMAENFEERITLTEKFVSEFNLNLTQKTEDARVKREVDNMLREQFELQRLAILKQSPLSPYYGDPFVNNRW
jgi:hypothetical protein